MDNYVDGFEDLETGHDSVTRVGWLALFNFTSSFQIWTLALALLFTIASGIVAPSLAIFIGKILDQFSDYGAGRTQGEIFAVRDFNV